MTSWDLVKIGLGNGLLPGQVKNITIDALVNWALKNKLHQKFNQNTQIFSRENPNENVCEMLVILFRHPLS